jgi:4-amino-4-deoxy-L-arabinose transferase-like glycosyltransferase
VTTWVPPGDRRWLAGILLVALALRIVWCLVAVRPPVGLHDPFFYIFYGDSISAGKGYTTLAGNPTAYYPVGYPAALGAVFWIVRHTPIPNDFPAAAAAFNVILGAVMVFLVYAIGRRLFNARVALTGAGLVAVFPNLVFHSAVALSETLFATLVLAALAVLLWEPWRGGKLSTGRALAFGVLLGLSALVRPQSLVLLPLAVIAVRATGVRWRPAIVCVLPALATAALMIVPWTIRNASEMHAFTLVSTNGGDDLCIGHNPDAKGAFNLSSHCFGGRAYRSEAGVSAEVERDKRGRSEAIRYATHHPGRELVLLPRKAYYMLYRDHDGLEAAESYGADPFISRSTVLPGLRLIANVFYFTVLIAGVVGATQLFDRERPRRLMLVVSLIGLLAVPLLFFGDTRFKVPAMPLLALVAALPISEFTKARVRLPMRRVPA